MAECKAHESQVAESGEAPNFKEARRRTLAVADGEMKTVDGPEALARVRKLILQRELPGL